MLQTKSGTHFEKAVTFSLRWEGGFNDTAGDTGGPTNFGIALNKHPELTYKDIQYMTAEKAKAIYKRQYWIPSHCDDLPFPVCIVHFDIAVNSGVTGAAKLLQKVLGASQDGVIGPKTLALIAAIKQPMVFAEAYIDARERWYKDLVLDYPGKMKSLKGWLNRTAALREAIKSCC